MMKKVENKAAKVVEDSELEPDLEVVTELVSLQEEIFSRSTKVVEVLIETLVDLSAQPTLELAAFF